MKKLRTISIVWLLGTLLFCGKKQEKTPVLVFNNDTLSRERIYLLEPLEVPDSVRYRNVGIRLLCERAGGKTVSDSIVTPFRERVSLITNLEWTGEAAALLLDASAYVMTLVNDSATCGFINSSAASLCTRLKTMIVPEGVLVTECPVCRETDTNVIEKKMALVTVLGISAEVAALVEEFLAEDQDGAAAVSGKDAKQMIQGLVSSPDAKSDTKASGKIRQGVKAPAAQTVDNSAATLRFRGHTSIRDSISQHIPNLKQLYKKKLKNTSALSGKVIVTLRVAPDGHVLSVAIKQTQISDQTFLKPFAEYLKTIRFKPIPEKTGAITFDFPFEFSAEM